MNNVLAKFKLLPVVLAPMAGVSTPQLVAAACNEGVLGILAGGLRSPAQLADDIDELRSLLSPDAENHFGVNLFIPTPEQLKQSEDNTEDTRMQERIRSARESVLPFYRRIGSSPPDVRGPTPSKFDELLDVVVEKKVPVVTFVFGRMDKRDVQRLKSNGTVVMGTATTVEEAILLESDDVDGIVAQGSEAGGHRGSFLPNSTLIGSISLIPQVVDAVHVPVIATGGLADGRGIAAVRALGASAGAIGTAFLTSAESEASPLHKKEILHMGRVETETIMTDVFSGRLARSLVNDFVRQYACGRAAIDRNTSGEAGRCVTGTTSDVKEAEDGVGCGPECARGSVHSDVPEYDTTLCGTISNHDKHFVMTQQSNVAPWTAQQAFTNPLKKHCLAVGDSSLMSMWCGQSLRLATDKRVSEIVRKIREQLSKL
eukprot:CFRG6800T1